MIYNNDTFSDLLSLSQFMKFLQNNDLIETFSEVSKLNEIALTTPVATAEAERCFSTLKRIKTFLRNTMGQDRLNALAVLSIQKERIAEILDFNQKVIENFASKKNRRTEYLFK